MLAVVVEAVLRVGKRALKNRVMVVLAALAFVAIFFFAVPFPLIVLAAALIGLIGGRLRSDLFLAAAPGTGATGAADSVLDEQLDHTRPSLGRALRVLAAVGRPVGGTAAAARGDLRLARASSARWPCSSPRWRW